MPRSSRHKSHKQHKHSSKDREYSDSEEDVSLKDKKGREEAAVRVSGSGEKRKLVSQLLDGKDLFGPGNGDISTEYVASKRHKDRADAASTDRWNSGEDERREGLIGDKDTKAGGSRPDLEKGPKSKVSVDSKSKSSKRHDSLSERKEENVTLALEIEEARNNSSKIESKRKSEKDPGRKEDHQYKDVKDKERGVDRDRKVQDVRHERSVDSVQGMGVVGSEASRTQGSRSGAFEEERLVKQGDENTGKDVVATILCFVESFAGTSTSVDTMITIYKWDADINLHHKVVQIQTYADMLTRVISDCQIQDELRNPELEKELEKRIRRRRGSSGDDDKYQGDVRDKNDRRLSSRDDHAKDGRYEDEKFKDGKLRDKYLEDLSRDNRHRDDKHRDERSSRDHTSDRSDTKHTRDENKTAEIRHRNSKPQDSGRDSSPHIDDRGTRYKDNRGKKRSSDDTVDHNDIRSQSIKDHRSDAGKKSLSSSKVETDADRGRSQSRRSDVENSQNTVSSSRRKSSPRSNAHIPKDQSRHSKQAESKYRDIVSEEKVRANATSIYEVPNVSVIPERASESWTKEKTIKKRGNFLNELSAKRSPRLDAQASPVHLDKSPSSTGIDHRYLNRTSLRRSLDVEETGRRNSSSKDARDCFANEDRLSRDFLLERTPVDEFSQADGDTVSVSSSFDRTSHLPSNSSSLLPPPPFRAVVESPSVMGSSEEENRGNRSSNRHKRSGDLSVGRGQGNTWKGVPNWSSPVTNGFIPFQQGPPHGGFHALLQQFPVPPLFGGRPSMELNHTGVPYHIPDTDRFSSHGRPFGWRNPVDDSCPPHLHAWDGNSGVFGNESHIYGRPDWNQNRHLMSGRGWETSADMWKGQNGGANMELPTALQKEDYPLCTPADEVWPEQSSQRYRNERNRPGLRAESIEIKRSSGTLAAKHTSEAPKIIHEKTPEPLKISSDDSACFRHVYLSKLDISADLTHPELYNQCMNLLDLEQDITDDVTDHVHPEEGAEAVVEIFNASIASLLPTIGNSAFQIAMALYKKQSENLIATLPVSPFTGSEPEKVPTSDGKKLELVPTADKEKVEEPSSISNQEKAEEPVLLSDWKKAEEPIPTCDQEKLEEPIPTCDQEKAEGEPDSTPCEEKVEEPVQTPYQKAEGSPKDPVPAFDQKPEEPLPTSHQEKAELVTTLNWEKSEDAVEDCSSFLENSSRAATDTPSNNDIMCVPLINSDSSSEAYEALMPESIESGLVNLCRIHPESTH
ncbi:hypothetical protein HHK36_000074 [Tetracentron sinense]|uniref:Uncharacterized protein n=1 Tax=Tetracentron sinense TaxID=13715 RepID=A0A834ZVN5_TETSI|nr:hypothetical protein HHK36_000074 [Tetracentron sinense]